MKRVWRKLNRCELLYEYLLFSVLALVAGGLLIAQIVKIDRQAPSAAIGIRVAILFAVAFLAIIMLTGFSLYKKSVSYIAWYKDVFNAIPMPLIVTGEEAEWLQINKAMRKAMNWKGKCNLENLNSRHLLDADGSVKNRIWLHNGKNYQVAGKPLRCGGRYAGYLIFLKEAPETPQPDQIQTEIFEAVNKHVQYLSVEAEYLRGCADNVSGHMLWQSDMIVDLLTMIDGVASGNLNDPQELNEKIGAVRAEMQRHSEHTQAGLEQMRRILAARKAPDASGESCLHESDTA